MANITRATLANQLEKSTAFPSLMITDNANEAKWLASPTHGDGDRVPFFKDSITDYAYLKIGAGLTINGDDQLEADVMGSAISTIRDEGLDISLSNTILDFVGAGITATDEGSSVTRIALDSTLNSLAGFNANGFMVQTSSDTFAARSITGTTNRITVSNQSGAANPVIDIDAAFGSSGLADAANIMLLTTNQTVASGVKTFTENVVLNAAPTIGTHATNKAYVDGLILDRKGTSARLISTTNVALTGEQTIDTLLTSTDKVLLAAQTDTSENGLYVTAAGAWTRSADMDIAAEVLGTLVLIEEGTHSGEIWYTLSTVVTLETDPILFVKLATGEYTGSGALDQVTFWADTKEFTGSTTFKFKNNQLVIGDTAYNGDTVITSKGTGTGDATYGYVHKNSDGNSVFKIHDSGKMTLGLAASDIVFTNVLTDYTVGSNYTLINTNADLEIASGTQVVLQGGGTASTLPGVIANITRNDLTNNQLNVKFNGLFNPNGVGTNTYTELLVTPTINQTTHTGNSFSVIIAPALTNVLGTHTALTITAASQVALHTTAGNIKFDIPSAAAYDMQYRADTTGYQTRIPNGTTGQVLVATSGAAPSWGAVPTVVNEAYWEFTGVSDTTVALNAGTDVKDVNGTLIGAGLFTAPTDLKKFHVYRNGIKQHMNGTLTTRDYSVNTTTHIVTFELAVDEGEIVHFIKYE